MAGSEALGLGKNRKDLKIHLHNQEEKAAKDIERAALGIIVAAALGALMRTDELVCGTLLPAISRPALPLGARDFVADLEATLGLGKGVTGRSLEGEFRTLQVSWPYTRCATVNYDFNGAHDDYDAHCIRDAHSH